MFADYVKPRECSLGSLRVSAKGRLLANATGGKSPCTKDGGRPDFAESDDTTEEITSHLNWVGMPSSG